MIIKYVKYKIIAIENIYRPRRYSYNNKFTLPLLMACRDIADSAARIEGQVAASSPPTVCSAWVDRGSVAFMQSAQRGVAMEEIRDRMLDENAARVGEREKLWDLLKWAPTVASWAWPRHTCSARSCLLPPSSASALCPGAGDFKGAAADPSGKIKCDLAPLNDATDRNRANP